MTTESKHTLPANPFCEGVREFSKWEDMLALMTEGRLWGADWPALDGPRPMSFEDAATVMRGRSLPFDETERVLRFFERSPHSAKATGA